MTMEVATVNFAKGLKGYWRRKGYERLDGSGRRRKARAVRFGNGGAQRRSWRVRVGRRVRFLRALSPKKLLVRLRDAYVKMMLAFANSRMLATSGYGYGSGYGFAAPAVKEYDEKMLVEIYKLMVAQQAQLTGRELTVSR